MSQQRSLKVTDQAFTDFNQFKIRLANSTGNIPTVNSIVNALMSLGNKHYSELIEIIKADTK